MKNSIGETVLEKMISNMEPVLNEGDYVFSSVLNINDVPRDVTIFEMKEKEGVTVVVSKDNADQLCLSYDYIAGWITLNIHSSLDAVGLTAAFATALGENDISCNVVAGYYHDHIFVNSNDSLRAIQVLRKLAENCTS